MIAAGARTPAVLIVNPNAGRSSEASREGVIGALRARFEIRGFSTTARDTGISLAARAAEEGEELVIAFGGDGHINEVVNGLAGTETKLGIIPGGTMNVFARALGIPLDPYAAIDHLVARLNEEPRWISLGKMDHRYFTFSAGCGFDAEAAERVERYVPVKRRMGELFFYWSAFRVLAGTYRHRSPTMELTGPFGTIPVAMAIACNAGPYAYLFGRRIEIAPHVRLDGGLDVFALRTMRIEALPLYVWRSIFSGDLTDHDDAFYANDLTEFEIHSDKPFSRHTDGEPLSSGTSAHFSLAKEVLKVSA
jgi:diacylglycerol kinase family enzyme